MVELNVVAAILLSFAVGILIGTGATLVIIKLFRGSEDESTENPQAETGSHH